jgi:hypothetical protein
MTAGNGEIFLSALKEKSDALLKTLQNIALSVDEQFLSPKSRIKKSLTVLTDLVIKNAESGSLTLELEVPLPDQPLSENQFDTGLMALQKFRRICSAIIREDKREFMKELPDSVVRNRLIKSFEKLYPRDGDNYSLSFGNGGSSFFAVINSNNRQQYKKMMETPEDEFPELIKITGQIVEIRAYAGRRHITVKNSQKEIPCFYTEMEDELSQLICGSIVEVSGEAQINKDGSIKQIDRIHNIEIIDLSPIKITGFVWQNKRFSLNKAIAGTIDYQDSIWIYEIPRYNLCSYSKDRKEAFSLLNEQFAFQYNDLFSEPEENLTNSAKKLRDLIKSDLKTVEEIL